MELCVAENTDSEDTLPELLHRNAHWRITNVTIQFYLSVVKVDITKSAAFAEKLGVVEGGADPADMSGVRKKKRQTAYR